MPTIINRPKSVVSLVELPESLEELGSRECLPGEEKFYQDAFETLTRAGKSHNSPQLSRLALRVNANRNQCLLTQAEQRAVRIADILLHEPPSFSELLDYKSELGKLEASLSMISNDVVKEAVMGRLEHVDGWIKRLLIRSKQHFEPLLPFGISKAEIENFSHDALIEVKAKAMEYKRYLQGTRDWKFEEVYELLTTLTASHSRALRQPIY